MATRDTGQPASGITRRDFLKTSAAAATVAGCGLAFAYDPEKAAAYENSAYYSISTTTCPYCSASCGQRVVTATPSHPDADVRGTVVDIYGDFQSPMNEGGLCAKGAGSYQLVTNPRRIGAWAGAHPVENINGTKDNIFAYDSAAQFLSGIAYRREGNQNWTKVPLADAFDEIAIGLKAARAGDTAGWPSDLSGGNSKSVAFFGSSHMNNEPNWMYRKIVANFGTSNVEHQARI